MCLYFLDLLQYEHFRREIVNAHCCKFIDDQAILLWQHYTRRRTKLYTMNNGVIQMEPNTSNPNGTPNGNNGHKVWERVWSNSNTATIMFFVIELLRPCVFFNHFQGWETNKLIFFKKPRLINENAQMFSFIFIKAI